MELILLILLTLHLLLSGLYAWDWYRDNGRIQECVIRLVFCLFLPLVGVLVFKLIDYFADRCADAQMDELYLGQGQILDELRLLRPVSAEAEIDTSPAVDVLTLGDYDYRRRMIMDTLRDEDTIEYLPILRQALSNEDRETSHYASTVIMDLQKRVQDGLARCRRAWKDHPEDPACQAAYEQELYRTITSSVFDKSTMGRYRSRYEQLSGQLLAGPKVEPDWYHHRIQLDLALGDNLHASELADRFVQEHPDNEDAVVDRIQVFIRLADRQGLDQFLARLKQMPVMLTSKSLPYIRFLS